MARRGVAAALSEIDRRLDQNELLSAEDRAQIKQKAREHVAKKRRDKAEAELLAKEIRNEEISYNPLEQTEQVLIDLAPFVASKMNNASFISLDGKMFFHGLVYEVPYGVARTLDDVMARTWEHENEIHGQRRKSDVNRRPLYEKIRPGDEGRQSPTQRVNTRSSINESSQI